MEGLKETAGKRNSSRGNPYSNAVRNLEALLQQKLGQLAELELEKKELRYKEETLVVAGGQYVHQLLSNASPEQWECAMTWGKEEWGTYFCQLICLTLSYNNIGVREASVINYSSYELVEDIPPEHWQQGYCRSMTHIVAQQQAIKQAVDAATDADADVLGPVTALKLAAVEQVQQMLGAHLAVWANAANVIQFFAANTLTKMQIAQFLVGEGAF
eukprot:gene3767-4026_t